MADQAEARHIGAGAGPQGHGNPGRVPVERRHQIRHRPVLRTAQQLRLGGGGQDTGTQGLGEHQQIPLPGPPVGQYRSGVDQAADAQAVLGLRVLDAVAACGHCASLRHLGRAPLQDGPHRFPRQAGGDGQQIHGQPGLAPHGVHVGEGVGRRDLPKVIGVVHYWREEIHRLDQRQLIREAVHRGVIAGVIAHQQVGLKRPGQPGQNLLQDTRSQLGPSPTGRGHGGQAQLLIRHRLTPSLFYSVPQPPGKRQPYRAAPPSPSTHTLE